MPNDTADGGRGEPENGPTAAKRQSADLTGYALWDLLHGSDEPDDRDEPTSSDDGRPVRDVCFDLETMFVDRYPLHEPSAADDEATADVDGSTTDTPGARAETAAPAADPFETPVPVAGDGDVESADEPVADDAPSAADGAVDDRDHADETSDFAGMADDVDDDDTAANLDDLESLPSQTDTGQGSESMFGDLVNRLTGGDRGNGSAQDDPAKPSQAVGQLARLEEEGVLDPDVRTLLVANRGSDVEHDTCSSIMTHAPPEESNILLVWLARENAERFDRLLDAWEYRPARLGIVSHPDTFRKSDRVLWDDDSVTMQTIRDPSDLTQVGISISKAMDGWEETHEHTYVCIDSISELLRHNETDRVFRFLHILEGRLASVDATAHYHLDSRNHELHTIRTLQSLLDHAYELTDDGATRMG